MIQIGVELKTTSSCDTDWRGTENSITHNGKSKLSNSITCLSLQWRHYLSAFSMVFGESFVKFRHLQFSRSLLSDEKQRPVLLWRQSTRKPNVIRFRYHSSCMKAHTNVMRNSDQSSWNPTRMPWLSRVSLPGSTNKLHNDHNGQSLEQNTQALEANATHPHSNTQVVTHARCHLVSTCSVYTKFTLNDDVKWCKQIQITWSVAIKHNYVNDNHGHV